MGKYAVVDGHLKHPRPEEVDSFHCDCLNLTTLKGCPRHVNQCFSCYGNKLTSLKDGPEYVGETFECSINEQLEDISDLPTMIKELWINSCPNIKVFTKQITNEQGLFKVFTNDDIIKQRIFNWPYYDAIETEDEEYGDTSIKVRIKPDNELFINSL